MRDLIEQDRPHAAVARKCLGNLPDDAITKGTCTFTAPGAAGSVVLLGDSNAAQFVEPAAEAANRLGLNLVVATFNSCPFADVVARYGQDELCRSFVTQWVRALDRTPPALAIVASSSSEYVNDPRIPFEDPVTHGAVSDAVAKAMLWERGVAAVVSRLTKSGVPVAIIHTIPHFGQFDLRTCPAFRIYVDQRTCGRTSSRSQIEEFNRLATLAEDSAVRGHPLSIAVDFTADVCTPTECSTERAGRWLYRDGGHLTVDGALTLTPRFQELIQRHARR